MTTPYTRNMPNTLTYWAAGAMGVNGLPGTAAPVTVSCRWQDTNELVRTPDGREQTSSALVYTARELGKGWIAEGDLRAFATPADTTGAYEIIKRMKNSSRDGSRTLYKVMV